MIIMTIVGIIMIIIGIIMIVFRNIKKSQCIELTTGKITDIVTERTKEKDMDDPRINYTKTSFYPIIEYSVGDKKYIKKSSTGSSHPMYFVGQEIEIHYNPNRPEEYYMNKNLGLIIIGIPFIIMGIIVTILGVII